MHNRGKRSVLFSVFSVLVACTSSNAPVVIPATVLPKDSMVSLLVDIHLLEASIDQGMINGTVKGNANAAHPVTCYRIFESHHTTRSAYDRSMAFYCAHPDLLAKLYEQVISELSRKQIGLK